MTDQATDTHSPIPAAEPLALRLSEGLGPTATDAGVMDLALRFDESAAWLLRGEAYPKGRGVGAGQFLEAATMLRRQSYEIERLRAALLANHKWHQDTDDYGGYDESELWEINTAALGPNGLLKGARDE